MNWLSLSAARHAALSVNPAFSAAWPKKKETITIRLDGDVLAWFRRSGQRCQTRINAVLRSYMRAQKRRA